MNELTMDKIPDDDDDTCISVSFEDQNEETGQELGTSNQDDEGTEYKEIANFKAEINKMVSTNEFEGELSESPMDLTVMKIENNVQLSIAGQSENNFKTVLSGFGVDDNSPAVVDKKKVRSKKRKHDEIEIISSRGKSLVTFKKPLPPQLTTADPMKRHLSRQGYQLRSSPKRNDADFPENLRTREPTSPSHLQEKSIVPTRFSVSGLEASRPSRALAVVSRSSAFTTTAMSNAAKINTWAKYIREVIQMQDRTMRAVKQRVDLAMQRELLLYTQFGFPPSRAADYDASP